MHKDQQTAMRLRLTMRVERLAQLLKLHAPKPVLATEVMLVLRAAVGYCGDFMGLAWQAWMEKAVRHEAGLCIDCGATLEEPAGKDLCPHCAPDAASMKEVATGNPS